MAQTFDAIVIGAGEAGPSLTSRLTASGMKVALIERDKFGGTCVNTGCIPTKTMIASAYAAHMARRAAEFGIDVPTVTPDFRAIQARTNSVVDDARNSVENAAKSL